MVNIYVKSCINCKHGPKGCDEEPCRECLDFPWDDPRTAWEPEDSSSVEETTDEEA